MGVRPLERSPYTRMTRSALLIDSRGLSRHQARRFRLMHPVTAGTGDAASGMAALDSSYVCRLITMASEAGFVDSRGGQLRRVDDLLGRGRLDMRAGRSMTSLASIVFPAALLIEINRLMRILLKTVEDIFVTGLTRLRSDVGLRTCRGSRSLRLSGSRFRLLRRRFDRLRLLVAPNRQADE